MITKQVLPTLEQAYSGTLYGNVKPDSKEVVMFDPSELIEIEDQPFHPYPPDKLAELAEDIKENGQLSPCVVRKKDGKNYVLAGRNRKKACEIAGAKVSCIVIECDDATANLILVNSNLIQRQELLPSEKAYAFKLQKESYEAKGQRKTAAAVAEQNAENVKMVQRYIKLTDLSPALMNMVDGGQIPVGAGYDLSYLPHQDMEFISSYLSDHPDIEVSGAQAQTIRKLAPGIVSAELDVLFGIADIKLESDNQSTEKKEQKPKAKAGKSISFKIADFEQICICTSFDFENATSKEIKEFILESLETYFQS